MVHFRIQLFLYDIFMYIYTKIYYIHLIFIRFGHVQILKLELTDFNKKRQLIA